MSHSFCQNKYATVCWSGRHTWLISASSSSSSSHAGHSMAIHHSVKVQKRGERKWSWPDHFNGHKDCWFNLTEGLDRHWREVSANKAFFEMCWQITRTEEQRMEWFLLPQLSKSIDKQYIYRYTNYSCRWRQLMVSQDPPQLMWWALLTAFCEISGEFISNFNIN